MLMGLADWEMEKRMILEEQQLIERGQIWERPNGTLFTIDHVDLKYAYYWLDAGSRPQYRGIALENLPKRYRRIK